jgi:hypothetical protein
VLALGSCILGVSFLVVFLSERLRRIGLQKKPAASAEAT